MTAQLNMMIQRLADRLGARVSRIVRISILWGLFGGTIATVWSMPLMAPMIQEQGIVSWLGLRIVASFVPMFVLAVLILSGAESGAGLVQRPGRFLSAVAIGATFGMVVAWWMDTIFPFKTTLSLPIRLAYWWLNWMVLGGIFGWAGVLNLRRREDQVKLEMLMGRRALLARLAAQSQLMAARTQVDPELIVRTLNAVRDRYRVNANDAGILLDHLIDFLRLAMHRVRGLHPSVSNELSLLKAYLALRQAETGLSVDLQITGHKQPEKNTQSTSRPLFVLVRYLLQEVALAHAEHLGLHIDLANGCTAVTLDTGGISLPEEGLARLRDNLHGLSIGSAELDILHHLLDSGINRYVVKASIS